ncbi:hypothetical protein [Yersinia pseudotuberculosis]|uniref:Uncharacterized protein n=1 Tax=Yersinia pseudotuberculosis TaxID=633 RepID=A0A380Q474_YERPU|nr:hypothetical protein [Yersinia pseudotuberculosis]SUP80615.1 Uncharacterised protein [Yersinia pseudotuberculosis]
MQNRLSPTTNLSILIELQFLTSWVGWMLLALLQIAVFRITGSAFNIMLLIWCEWMPILILGPLLIASSAFVCHQ